MWSLHQTNTRWVWMIWNAHEVVVFCCFGLFKLITGSSHRLLSRSQNKSGNRMKTEGREHRKIKSTLLVSSGTGRICCVLDTSSGLCCSWTSLASWRKTHTKWHKAQKSDRRCEKVPRFLLERAADHTHTRVAPVSIRLLKSTSLQEICLPLVRSHKDKINLPCICVRSRHTRVLSLTCIMVTK